MMKGKKPLAAAIIDAMVDPVMVFDTEGNVTSVNPALEKIFGHKREEFIGKHILELPGIKSVKPEDVEKFVPLLKETIEKGSAAPLEFVFPTKDGRMIPVSLAGGVIKDVQGNPTHVVAVVRDLTELKRAEEREALREEAILEAVPDIVAVTDTNWRVIRWNKIAEKRVGYPPEEAKGKHVLKFIAEEDRDVIVDGMSEVFEKGYSTRKGGCWRGCSPRVERKFRMPGRVPWSRTRRAK